MLSDVIAPSSTHQPPGLLSQPVKSVPLNIEMNPSLSDFGNSAPAQHAPAAAHSPAQASAEIPAAINNTIAVFAIVVIVSLLLRTCTYSRTALFREP